MIGPKLRGYPVNPITVANATIRELDKIQTMAFLAEEKLEDINIALAQLRLKLDAVVDAQGGAK